METQSRFERMEKKRKELKANWGIFKPLEPRQKPVIEERPRRTLAGSIADVILLLFFVILIGTYLICSTGLYVNLPQTFNINMDYVINRPIDIEQDNQTEEVSDD